MALDVPSLVSGAAGRLRRGRLVRIGKSGVLVVEFEGEPEERRRCDWLETSHTPAVQLAVGDPVLVLVPDDPGARACVLGRIGRYAPPAPPDPVPEEAATPAVLVLEAGQELVLSCGASAIVLRQDGKVLIKGIDVVSRAARTQRIKGGSVQIN